MCILFHTRSLTLSLPPKTHTHTHTCITSLISVYKRALRRFKRLIIMGITAQVLGHGTARYSAAQSFAV